jgi:DNA-binding NarL/FixJ family response regulator
MTKRTNILLLDNSERITHRIELMLLLIKNIGEVEIAHTLATAKDILFKKEIDVVILDIKFSDGNGIVFLKEVKSSYPRAEIIMLTNHADEYHRRYAQTAGADYFIDKSLAFHQIPQIISEKITQYINQ